MDRRVGDPSGSTASSRVSTSAGRSAGPRRYRTGASSSPSASTRRPCGGYAAFDLPIQPARHCVSDADRHGRAWRRSRAIATEFPSSWCAVREPALPRHHDTLATTLERESDGDARVASHHAALARLQACSRRQSSKSTAASSTATSNVRSWRAGAVRTVPAPGHRATLAIVTVTVLLAGALLLTGATIRRGAAQTSCARARVRPAVRVRAGRGYAGGSSARFVRPRPGAYPGRNVCALRRSASCCTALACTTTRSTARSASTG